MSMFFQLLLNPAIISLFLGFIFGVLFPYFFYPSLVELVSLYLIFAIGFKGGACLGEFGQCSSSLMYLALLGLVIGLIHPFINYYILQKTTSLDRVNAIILATQYGSISIVTFITAVSFLTERAIFYDSFMSAVAGMMEIPALFSGLWILTKDKISNKNFFVSFFNICKLILSCKKISMIFVGFFVGLFLQKYEIYAFNSLIIWPFNYALILFMFDIGIKISKQRSSIKQINPSLIAFSIYMPLISGSLATFIASYMLYSVGTVMLFALLVASASYIAVPAVMRLKAPNSNEAIYMPLTLGVTLPFNILVGIPFFHYLANYLA
jgi:uncharacterized protein